MAEGDRPAPALDVQGLSVSFGGFRALADVSLQVRVGEIHGIVGTNGAGKSTLIDVLSGLVKPASGSVSVLGLDPIRQAGRLRSMVGVVSQETSLEEKLSALENLRYFGRLLDVPGAELSGRVEKLIRFMGLWERRDDRLETYSVGMKRKVHFASSLVHEPSVLLVDEATAGLDPAIRADVNRMMVDMARDRHLTVLLATHDLSDARDLCDRISMLHRGRLVSTGTWDEISAEHEATLVLKGVPAGDRGRLMDCCPGRVTEVLGGFRIKVSSISEAYRLVEELEKGGVHASSTSYGVPPEEIFQRLARREEEGSRAQ